MLPYDITRPQWVKLILLEEGQKVGNPIGCFMIDEVIFPLW